MRMRIAVLIVLLITTGIPEAHGGWGVESGRADDGDVAKLLRDKVALKTAQTRINRALNTAIKKERMLILMGMSSEEGANVGISELLRKASEYWRKEVLGIAKEIAANPAASCAEAKSAVSLVLGMMRQRALLGLTPDEGDRSPEAEQARAEDRQLSNDLVEVLRLGRQRCREEELDECNATGRFEGIMIWAVGEARERALTGGEDAATDAFEWAKGALGECANYELHWVSTGKIDVPMQIHSVLDGKIKMKFKPGEGGSLSVFQDARIEGETTGSMNPWVVSLKCAIPGAEITCGPGAEPTHPFTAKIRKMTMKHREFYLDATDVSRDRVVGENMLEFEFSGAVMNAPAVIVVPGSGTVPMPAFDAGWTSFRIAHRKYRGSGEYFKFQTERRGVYPIIFELTEAAADTEMAITGSDSTQFELIHRPQKKPFPPRQQRPPRKPLTPKSG